MDTAVMEFQITQRGCRRRRRLAQSLGGGEGLKMSDEATIRAFWQTYLETLDDNHPHRFRAIPEAWSFGDSIELADQLGRLVLQGIKTATCCRYLGENLVEEAGPSIIVDGKGQPLCVVETTEITVRRYKDVDAKFAADEGEGDRSLNYWRDAHWNFFTHEGAQEGYEVSEDMLLECERFRVLYRNSGISDGVVVCIT